MSTTAVPLSQAPTREPDCETTLQAVRDITQSEGSELLRRRLTESLATLFPVIAISFLTPAPTSRLNLALRCHISHVGTKPELAWDTRHRRDVSPSGALARAVLTQYQQTPDDDPMVDYFPVCVERKLLEIVEIRRSPLASCNGLAMSHMLGIYADFVRVLYFREQDALTGVLNRGAFDNQINITAQSLRQKSDFTVDPASWWLIMLDIDHFKRINDNYGHLIGDEVLLLVARIMTKAVRAVDKVYRYGGEEFAILVSPCRRADALALAERIRSMIDSAHFPQVEHITASAGLAPIDRFDHVANIVGRADQALYQAKRSGRNRVCEYKQRARVPLGSGLQAPGALELF